MQIKLISEQDIRVVGRNMGEIQNRSKCDKINNIFF